MRSPAAQRRAFKRLAVVKVVVVFQAPNLQKERVVGVFLKYKFFLLFPTISVLAASLCALVQPCRGLTKSSLAKLGFREGMQDAGTDPGATSGARTLHWHERAWKTS